MANDDGKNPADISRRDTLRLAAAVGALSAGLGALLHSQEARAEDIKLNQKSLGSIELKLYDIKGTDEYTLLKTVDLTELIKLKVAKDKFHGYSLKLCYVEHKERVTELVSHRLKVTSTRVKVE
jgi:hypothetical protein